MSALVVGAVASAEPNERDSEAIRVQLDPANGCFSADRFFAAVEARTSRVRRADATEPSRTLIVSVTLEGREVTGRLVLKDQSHESEPRIVRVSTCDEALSAMAFIAAISVDPNAGATPNARPRVDGGTDTSTDAGAVGNDDAPDKPSSASPTPSRAARTPPEIRGFFAAGGSVEALTPGGATSGVLFAPGAFVEIGVIAPTLFAPDLRLSGTRTTGATVTTSEGTASPLWLTLDLSLCPIQVLPPALRWTLAACADVEAGALHINAAGQEIDSRSRPWVAPGLGARLGWTGISPASRMELLVDFELGLRAPLIRDTFYFLDNPNDFRVYSAPALVAHGAIDVGVRFR